MEHSSHVLSKLLRPSEEEPAPVRSENQELLPLLDLQVPPGFDRDRNLASLAHRDRAVELRSLRLSRQSAPFACLLRVGQAG